MTKFNTCFRNFTLTFAAVILFNIMAYGQACPTISLASPPSSVCTDLCDQDPLEMTFTTCWQMNSASNSSFEYEIVGSDAVTYVPVTTLTGLTAPGCDVKVVLVPATISFDVNWSGYTNPNGGGNQCQTGSSSVIVPVELVSFNSKKDHNNIILEWQTATEINNDFFNIERSSDSKNFKMIGKVMGYGNTTETIDYDYTDRNPIKGTNYYRLKQFDYNGEFEYSEIISIDFDSRDDHKFINDLTTDFISVQNSIGVKSAQIFNTQGSKMGNFVNKNNDNLFTIPTNALASGQYIVIYNLTDGQQKVEKFMKF